MKYIPYATQSIDHNDIASVIDVLQSVWLTTGPNVEAFEKAVALHCGAKFAVAVSSATAALHIACLAAGLKAGDYLWTSPNTFVASANCGLYCGADIDFVDIDPDTYNMSIECLKHKLIEAEFHGRLPKVVVPVHFAGQSCDMDEIKQLANKYGFTIIEDASHAIGGMYQGKTIGSCEFSDMTVFSFHPVKIITTGEGGMVVTNNEQLYEHLSRLRSHGIVRNQESMFEQSHGEWYYQQIELGFNYRMTDLQAALGISQLAKINDFISKRQIIAKRYDQLLASYPVVLPYQNANTSSAWHLYVIKTQNNYNRKQIFDAMRASGIGVNVHYIPVHTQPYYRSKYGFSENAFPNAVNYYRHCLSLPMYYDLRQDEQEYVAQVLAEVLV